jgi:hypothetical protein
VNPAYGLWADNFGCTGKQASKQALTDHFGQLLSKFPARGEFFLLDYQVSLPQKA